MAGPNKRRRRKTTVSQSSSSELLLLTLDPIPEEDGVCFTTNSMSTEFSRAFKWEIGCRINLHKATKEAYVPLTDRTNDVKRMKQCAVCGSREGKVKRCAGCRSVYYCGRSCQKAAWPTHKNFCCPDATLPHHVQPFTIPLHSIVPVHSYSECQLTTIEWFELL